MNDWIDRAMPCSSAPPLVRVASSLLLSPPDASFSFPFLSSVSPCTHLTSIPVQSTPVQSSSVQYCTTVSPPHRPIAYAVFSSAEQGLFPPTTTPKQPSRVRGGACMLLTQLNHCQLKRTTWFYPLNYTYPHIKSSQWQLCFLVRRCRVSHTVQDRQRQKKSFRTAPTTQ